MAALPSSRSLLLTPGNYAAGVGVWGALPAVYDTTVSAPEHGVHVHARSVPGRKKDIDASFDSVEVALASGTVTIREAEATAYLAAAVLGLPVHDISCPYCLEAHLDEGYFAVHPHQRHRCAKCNMEFLLGQRAIGNPIIAMKRELGDAFLIRPTVSGRPQVRIRQGEDYCAAGILIWGSNPAILWTAARSEQAGIHVHAFRDVNEPPTIDDTYERVEVDGISLDAAMVRTYMIQRSMEHVRSTITHLRCQRCEASHFDDGAPYAVEPHRNHPCAACGYLNTTDLPVISNPLSDVLPTLYTNALHKGLVKNPLAL